MSAFCLHSVPHHPRQFASSPGRGLSCSLSPTATVRPVSWPWPFLFPISNRDSSPCLLAVASPVPYLQPRQFAPSPGRGRHCSLPQVAPSSCRRFCVFGNMAAFFCTFSLHLFLGLPARLVTWQLPSRLRFVVRHPFYMPSPLQSFPTHVRYPVTVCTFVQCMSTCSVTHSTLLFSLLSGDKFRPKMAVIIRPLYSNMNAYRY